MTSEAARLDRADEKENAIIAAARKTFLARGFDSASMDTIAVTAGVSKRTVYNRFRSKEELFAATIMDTCKRILPVNMDDVTNDLPPEQFMREMAISIVRALFQPEAIALRRIAAFEAARTPALGRAYLEHGPRWMVSTIAPVLERLAPSAGLEIDNVELAMWQLGSLITEPLHTTILMGETDDNLDHAIEKQVECGLEAFFKIYRRPD